MQQHLEIWRDSGRESVALQAEQVTLGSDTSNDVTIDEAAVSSLHCVLQHFPAGWSIRDLGSRNGTFVNGERIASERALRDGDEIRLGHIRIVLHAPSDDARPETETLADPPRLTPRERDVLLELCRPLLEGNAFTEPASVADVARALVVSEAAVKQHIGNLYDKFDLTDDRRKRVRLANVALQTGAVSLTDLK
jgi:pSer/pThr/pTyr-binding forkhead associated (FHA) protein